MVLLSLGPLTKVSWISNDSPTSRSSTRGSGNPNYPIISRSFDKSIWDPLPTKLSNNSRPCTRWSVRTWILPLLYLGPGSKVSGILYFSLMTWIYQCPPPTACTTRHAPLLPKGIAFFQGHTGRPHDWCPSSLVPSLLSCAQTSLPTNFDSGRRVVPSLLLYLLIKFLAPIHCKKVCHYFCIKLWHKINLITLSMFSRTKSH